jgi:hypothetical protein
MVSDGAYEFSLVHYFTDRCLVLSALHNPSAHELPDCATLKLEFAAAE